MGFCNCDGTLGNTGRPSGVKAFGIPRMILVQKTFNNGVRNSIPAGSTYDQAFIDAYINATDDTKMFPIGGLENVATVREASTFETFGSGAQSLVRQGVKPFSAFIPDAETTYLSKIKQGGCEDLQIYVVDECGSIRGSVSSDGLNLYGTKVQRNTWDPIYKERTDAESNGITLSFQFDINELDENLKMIASTDLDFDALALTGLIDVLSTVGAITATSVVIDLETCYGSFDNSIKFSGYAIADFVLTNNTTVAPVTIDTLVESPDGTYTLGYVAQTAADEMELTLAPAVIGFDLASTIYAAV